MVDRVSSSPSRIPVPIRHPADKPFQQNGRHKAPESQRIESPRIIPYKKVVETTQRVLIQENGSKSDSGGTQPIIAKKEKGFETFVMTGDMIIKTTTPPKTSRLDNLSNNPPSCQETQPQFSFAIDYDSIPKPDKSLSGSPSMKSMKVHNDENKDINEHLNFINTHPDSSSPLPQSSLYIYGKEPLSSGSFQSSDSVSSASAQSVTEKGDNFVYKNLDDTGIGSVDSFDSITKKESPDPDNCDLILRDNNSSSPSDSELLPSGDNHPSSVGCENMESPSDSSDDNRRNIITSKSAEKISSFSGQPLVRTSKSHENYLQGSADLMMVNIEIDDDMAYSMDALAYDQSSSSLDRINSNNNDLLNVETSKSLQNSPKKKKVPTATLR